MDSESVYGLSFPYRLGLLPLVDALACGDDAQSESKPTHINVHTLCRRVGIQAKDTVLVGDQPTDLMMGTAAGTAYNVGVLSGVGTR